MKTEGQNVLSDTQADTDLFIARARNVTRRSLGSWLARGVKAFSYYARLYPLLQQPGASAPAILFYHRIHRRPVGLWGEPVLDVEGFEQHMAFLAREYQPILLSELVAGLQGQAPLPARAVAVTFDDGYRSNLLLAAPILRHYRVPATLFVTTGLVGTQQWMWAYELEKIFFRYPLAQLHQCMRHPVLARMCRLEPSRRIALMACVEYLKSLPRAALWEVMGELRERLPVELDEDNRFLSWNEVRQLRGYGFELGAHTENHPILVRESPQEVERELSACRDTLERELGARPTLFAYPNGDTSPEVSERVGRYFEAAVTTRPGLCSPFISLLELPRIGAPESVSDLAFALSRLARQGQQAARALGHNG